jgi:uncharacterized protein (DUF1684 family)
MNKLFAERKKSWVTIILVLTLTAIALGQSSYRTQLQKWRTEREDKLKAEDGWLTVAGLFWLKEGVNSFGTDRSLNIVLPENSAPPKAGSLELRNDTVMLHVSSGVQVKVNDQPATDLTLKIDASNSKPDVITIGDLRMTVIKRGNRIGLRVRDMNSRARREFKGLDWFPVKGSFRVVANFTPFEKPKEITIVNVLGDQIKMTNPGILSFRLKGRTFELKPVVENDHELFIIFRDQTAGRSTYSAGRFLYADLPKDGKVILDFNKAENPPCAFTKFATCPLPPRQNFLPITIEAGELNYHVDN